MNPYDKALDAILRKVNLSKLHSDDRRAIAQLFDYLIRSGRRVGPSDLIGDYLTSKGVSEETAAEIQDIYEAIDSLHGDPAWSDEFLKSL